MASEKNIKKIPNVSNILMPNEALEIVKDWNKEMESLGKNPQDIQGLRNAHYNIDVGLSGSGKGASPYRVQITSSTQEYLNEYIASQSAHSKGANQKDFLKFVDNFNDLSNKAQKFIEKDEISPSKAKGGPSQPISNDVDLETIKNLKKASTNKQNLSGGRESANWHNSPIILIASCNVTIALQKKSLQ